MASPASTATTLTVAAAQFATGTDVSQNLATTLRMIGEAADRGADLVVLPEFCNHLSIYDSAEHAWEVAIDLEGDWVSAVSALAQQRNIWVQLNITVRRIPATEAEPRPRITNTNLVFDSSGTLRAANDKTVLMGAENDYLSVADEPSALIEAPFGIIGTYACMDGVVPEVPRTVAARGARLLLNSLNSFALDEAALHIPVRAAENRAWVVACCKVGPLLPQDKIDLFSSMMGVPGEMLCGAGESQIIAPDGTVVAMAPRTGEAIITAEIDLALGSALRPDGTDVWASRRPELYGPLFAETPPLHDHPRAAELSVATAFTAAQLEQQIANKTALILLPELGFDEVLDPEAVTELLADSQCCVISSCASDGAHLGLAVTQAGVVHRQAQLHRVARHPWVTALGDSLTTVDFDWGRLGIIVGEDFLYPEVARLAALQSVDVIALPMTDLEAWDLPVGVVERSAENRMIAIAASTTGVSLVANLPPDFTLWAPSRERVFDGTINRPDCEWATASATLGATVHPARTVNRQISKNTDLVHNRPWQLCEALLS